MSRSRRHTPISSWVAYSRKQARSLSLYKRARARIERARERLLLSLARLRDEHAAADLEVERAPWDEWDSPRDGKVYFGNQWSDGMGSLTPPDPKLWWK